MSEVACLSTVYNLLICFVGSFCLCGLLGPPERFSRLEALLSCDAKVRLKSLVMPQAEAEDLRQPLLENDV